MYVYVYVYVLCESVTDACAHTCVIGVMVVCMRRRRHANCNVVWYGVSVFSMQRTFENGTCVCVWIGDGVVRMCVCVYG